MENIVTTDYRQDTAGLWIGYLYNEDGELISYTEPFTQKENAEEAVFSFMLANGYEE